MPCDWKGNTIVSAHHNGTIVSLVNRASKLALLEKAEGQAASEVRKLVHKHLKGLPAHTLTPDNGKEFAHHRWGSRRLGVAWYFPLPVISGFAGDHSNFWSDASGGCGIGRICVLFSEKEPNCP